MHIKVWTDGGTRSNPGPGSWGAVIEGVQQDPVELSGFLPQVTNNQAEFIAFHQACAWLLKLPVKPDQIEIFSDSKLVVEQINHRWRVKDPVLKTFFDDADGAYSAIKKLTKASVTHIHREFNTRADALCNIEMDKHGVVSDRQGKPRCW